VKCLKKLPVKQNWKALTLFSIIIVVSLLATFLLTRLLSEPIMIAETITLETVKWESERPYGTMHVGENVRGFYEKEIKLFQEISIDDYHAGSWEYGGSDYVELWVNATVALQTGL